MYETIIQRKILALIIAFTMQFGNGYPENDTSTTEVIVNDLNVSTVSVSCLKVEWKSEPDRDYTVTCEALSDGYTYAVTLQACVRVRDIR
jgi:hypothetical protein